MIIPGLAFNITPVYSIPQKAVVQGLYNCEHPLEDVNARECLAKNKLGLFTKTANEDTVRVTTSNWTKLVLAKKVKDQLVEVEFSRTDKEFTMNPRLTAEGNFS